MNQRKTGRPPSLNPKSEAIHVRIDSETALKLESYCERHEISKTEAIRRGIIRILEDEKK